MATARRKTPDPLAMEPLAKTAPLVAQVNGNGALSPSNMHTPTSPTGKFSASDKWSLALLFVLYTLQGVPMGLSGSLPMILQTKGASFSQQAILSLASWPFSLKLLWAPLVDSMFTRRCGLGRRKTWLIPSQLVCAAMMMVMGCTTLGDALLGDAPRAWGSTLQASQADVPVLTAVFAVMYFLMATQDIAVDGWALTMLTPANVGYASTANSVGQSIGYFLAYVGFLAAYSPEFCNAYLRAPDAQQPQGIMGLSAVMLICGTAMLVTTLVVWVFKHEGRESEADMDPPLPTTTIGRAPAAEVDTRNCMTPVLTAYQQMWQIMKLPAVQSFALLLVTFRAGYAATDSVASLKLMDRGVPKSTMAMLALGTLPCSFIFPIVVAKTVAGPRPLDLLLKWHLPRLAMGVGWVWLVWIAPMAGSEAIIPTWYYVVMVLLSIVHQFFSNAMFCALMGMFARVSDPAMGGTYMTLLNTIANLGAKWPTTLALALVEPLTSKACSTDGSDCSEQVFQQACVAAGGTCSVVSDGFYILSFVLTAVGVGWYFVFRKRIDVLTGMHRDQWRCSVAS